MQQERKPRGNSLVVLSPGCSGSSLARELKPIPRGSKSNNDEEYDADSGGSTERSSSLKYDDRSCSCDSSSSSSSENDGDSTPFLTHLKDHEEGSEVSISAFSSAAPASDPGSLCVDNMNLNLESASVESGCSCSSTSTTTDSSSVIVHADSEEGSNRGSDSDTDTDGNGGWSTTDEEDEVDASPMHRITPRPVGCTIQPDQALKDPLFLTYGQKTPSPTSPRDPRGGPIQLRKKIPMAGEAAGAAARIKGDMKRERHNSTNTCLVTNVIPAPIIDDILHCVSYVIRLHVEKNTKEQSAHTYYDLFDENRFPLTKVHTEQTEIPTEQTVYEFLQPIFHSERLGAEICVMMLAYVERVMAWKNVAMLPRTWRRVCLGALILASKVWEDQSVWNVDFVHCFDNVNAHDLGQLERDFLNLIEFNVGLKASAYVSYFIALQKYSKQPRLPETGAAKVLESISHEKQAEMQTLGDRKTNSTSSLPIPSSGIS